MIRVTRVVTVFLVTLAFVATALNTSASDTQYGYGSAPKQAIVVDKLVNKPGTGDYIDNLSPSDPRFAPGQEVFFKLIVKNPSDAVLNDVTVKDFLPDFVESVEGPGSYDAGSREFKIDAGDFDPHQEKIYVLKARVVGSNRLPSDQSIVCVVNRVQASNSDVSDEDTAQFCAERQVTNVTTVPSAGPEMGLALLAFNAFGFGVGMHLRKKR